MSRIAPVAAVLLLAAAAASAHDYPIKPVSIVLRVEPDRVAADIDSDSIYWIEEVLDLHPMLPSDWPASTRAKAEAYANAHLRLTAGGKRLTGRLTAASYLQRPWEVYEQGRIRLRLEYPPVADGETLSGEADFFEEYRQERLQERAPILPIQDFRAIVTVPGRTTRRFELKPGAIAFSVPVADARPGLARRLARSLALGASAVLTGAAGWPALAALALSLAPGAPSRRRAILLAAAALAGAAAAGRPLPWLPWLAGACGAAAAARWLSRGPTLALEAAAAAAVARHWQSAVLPWLPGAAPEAAARGASALGVLAAASCAALLGLLAADAEARRLFLHSESRAGELFERRRRLAAVALIIVSAFGLAQNLAR
ncbi:MAG TPA: hypothetical protein VN915_07625 [Elusimicrobiota bacterium]|nr:hypothetical protein [Elusimicrobiota bacterium]